MNGVAWTLTNVIFSQGIRLVSNVLLAALLFREAFALMAIVTTLMIGATLLSDIGLGPSIIHSKRGNDRDFLDTAWTMQVIRGLILALLATALAWPIAAFYSANDPLAMELRLLIPLVALSTLIDGFQSTKLHSATRHINLGKVTMIRLASQISGILVMVGAAWWTRSIYSIPAGGLVTSVVMCVCSHFVLTGTRNRFHLEISAVKEIFHFGKWVFVSTVIYFFATQLDKLVLARVFPLADVGVYSIAASLAMLTLMLMANLQSSILFPLYSRVLDGTETLASVVLRTKTPLLVVGAYMVALTVACAGAFIDLAYDDRYKAASLYIPLLAAGAWCCVVEGIYGAAFLATGRSRWIAVGSFTKVIAFCALLSPAIYWGGLVGAVIAWAASDALKMCMAIYLARKLDLKTHRIDLWYTVYFVLVCLGVYWISHGIDSIKNSKPLVLLTIQFVLVTLAFAPKIFKVSRAFFPK